MDALQALKELPRLDLRGFVSPLQLLERFSDAVGVEVWCKRDDIGAVGLAGNKVRKLEVELAYALSIGSTHLLAEGSRLSNATRAVAAASAVLGLKCTLVLCHEEPKEPVGNLMLDGLLGADLRFVGDRSWEELSDEACAVERDLRKSGEHVYRLPLGCASSRSCVGFALGFIEAREQLQAAGRDAATIIHASSSGGTHAGLVLGNALERANWQIEGIVVAGAVYPDLVAQYLSFAQGGADLLGADLHLRREHIRLDETYLGSGYGEPAPGLYEAIDLLATTEGILSDPVYSGKAVAALVDKARKRQLEGPVVLWHTGGYHALFDPKFASRIWSSIDRLAKIRL